METRNRLATPDHQLVTRSPERFVRGALAVALVATIVATLSALRLRDERDAARRDVDDLTREVTRQASEPAQLYAGVADRAFFSIADGGSLGVLAVDQPNGQQLYWLTLHMSDVEPGTEFQIEAGRCVGDTSESLAELASPVSSSDGRIELVQPNLRLEDVETYWLRVRGPGGEDFGGVRGPFFGDDAVALGPGDPTC